MWKTNRKTKKHFVSKKSNKVNETDFEKQPTGITHHRFLKRSDHKLEINYEEASRRFENFLNKTNLKEFTFDPQTNKGFDFRDRNDAKQFHNMFAVSNEPVYVIGVTNQIGLTNSRELHSNFEHVKGNGYRPLFGTFVGMNGMRYVDVPIVEAGISEDRAINKAKHYAQETIVVIFKNGDVDQIDIQ